LPARGGRGIAENGFGAAGVGGAGTAEGGAGFGIDGVAGASLTGAFASRLIFSIWDRVPSSRDAIAASISSGVGAGFATAFFEAAFLTGFGESSAGFISGNFSINLRTTGASTVEDAERTNSPTSCNLASKSLLSKPNSFANS
jgi:hypothetical protein